MPQYRALAKVVGPHIKTQAVRAAKTAIKYGKYGAIPAAPILYDKAKKKYNSSQTTTATKRKYNKKSKSNDNSPAIHYNHGRSFKISDRFVRMVRQAAAAIDSHTFKGTMQMTAAIGQCNYAVPHLLYDPDHIASLNVNSGNYNDGKFVVRNAISTIQLANARNSCTTLRIYECQARTDVPYLAATYVSPYNYLITGWADAGLSSNLNNIGATAFSSSAFTTWFKVLDVKNIELQPGECKRITLEDRSSTTINMERWRPGGTKLSIAHGKKTKFFLFQYWGQTVNDSVDTTQVSTDVVKIDCVHTVKYEYQYVLDQNPTNYSDGALGNVVTPEFINENTSAVTTGASS